jgi:hypothetical protein
MVTQTLSKTTPPSNSITVTMLAMNGQVIDQLKNLFNSIKKDSPMLVVEFKSFSKFGKLPRSNDKLTKEVSLLPAEHKIVFISHRWLRPWQSKQECEEQGHEWAGMAHPDDEAASKHKLICAGIAKLAEKKQWDLNNVCLWLDFCCVEQDNLQLLQAGVASLRGYISVCDAVLIPSPEVPAQDGNGTVDMIAGGYGERAWTRLESMSFYAVRECMCVCVCVYGMFICVCVCVCVCAYVYMHVYMHTLYVYMHTHTHTDMYAYMHTHTDTHT